MSDHVLERFPDCDEGIRALLEEDAIFREICADYEEIGTWLAARQEAAPPSWAEYERAREVRDELEQEIQKKLRKEGYILPLQQKGRDPGSRPSEHPAVKIHKEDV